MARKQKQKQKQKREQKNRKRSPKPEPASTPIPEMSRSSVGSRLDAQPDLHAVHWKNDWPHLLAVFFGLLAVYIATAPRTVTMEDSGLFIMSCFHMGISHPPGYPIHSVLGKFFTLIPIGSAAFRVHLLSATFGALTCAAIWWIALALCRNRIAAYLAALGYGVSREFWAQSIIADVYSMNTFFFFLVFALTLHFMRSGDRRFFLASAFCFGSSISHHWPLMVISSPCFFFMLWPQRAVVTRSLHKAIPLFLLGLLPYAYLFIRSNYDPLIAFHGPIADWRQLWGYFIREGFSGVEDSISAGAWDQQQFQLFLIRESIGQFTIAGGVLALLGFIRSWKHWPLGLCIGLLLAFLGGTHILATQLNFDYEYFGRSVFQVYPLIPYGVMAIWIGLCVTELSQRIKRDSQVPLAIIAVLLVGTTFASNFGGNDRRHDRWANDYGTTILESLERDSIFVTHTDSDTGPLGYLHYVENLRPDVEIYNDQGLVFQNRLFLPAASSEARRARLIAMIKGTSRTVYFTDPADLELPWGIEDHGLFYKVRKDLAPGTYSFVADPDIIAYFDEIETMDDMGDAWSVFHRGLLIARAAWGLTQLVHLSEGASQHEALRPLLDRLTRSYLGKLIQTEVLFPHSSPEELASWLEEMEPQLDDTVGKKERAHFYFLRGHLEARRGDPSAAVDDFQRSLEIYHHPSNLALLTLLEAYAGGQQVEPYHDLRKTFEGADGLHPRIQELDQMMRSRGH